MENRLGNKNIIITGASSGIGEQLAWQAARQGATPILIARSEDKLKAIAEAIYQKVGQTCPIYICDLLNEESLQSTFHQILKNQKKIDVLINNAGFGIFDNAKDADFSSVKNMFQLNALAVIQATQLVLPQMLERNSGHIINIASQAGKIATPKSSGYAASKHAVLGFTNALRLEVEKQGVYVTSVNLGPVKTNFFNQADPTGKYQNEVSKIMLDPDKVAQKVVNSLFHKKREINLPLWMDIGSRIYSLMPSFMEKILKKQFSKK